MDVVNNFFFAREPLFRKFESRLLIVIRLTTLLREREKTRVKV